MIVADEMRSYSLQAVLEFEFLLGRLRASEPSPLDQHGNTLRLYTNSVPSDNECQRIRDLVIAPMKEVADLTPEIIHAQAHPDQLTRKRDDLTEFIDSHLALVSPARKLPHDILREIFKVSSIPASGYLTLRIIESPLQISHVVVDTAVLIQETRVERLNDGLKEWLRRSRSLPLTITVTWISDEFGNPLILLQTLTEVSRRWRHVRLILPSYDSFFPLKFLSPDDVPMLKTVVIDTGSQPGRFTTAPLPLRNSCPLLAPPTFAMSLSGALPAAFDIL
ncbi:hypothetical protein DFH09DRAFT_1381448 [Mycena vulgaris]|nr:hypothetical protein DFH09DRAFT_1381448 [Mycena vulgaris]